MNLTRILSLLVPVLLIAPVAGVVAPASAAVAETTTITISGAPRVGIFRDEIGGKTADVFRHKGRLATSTGDPVAGATVYLERMLTTDDAWVRFTPGEDMVTNANGVYTFFTFVEGNAKYRVVYEGDPVYSPVTSAVQPLKAMRDFNSELVEKKQSAVLKGRINPDWDNKSVSWEKRTCKKCKWKTIETAKSGDNGSWSFNGGYPPVGKTWYFRAFVAKTPDFVKSYSHTLETTTTRSRAPAARTS